MNQKLSGESMRRALDKRIEQAGIRPLTWHDLRRSLISELLDKGVDIKTVADIVGHKSVNTTARYDRRDEKTMRKAISMLLLPYRSRKVRK
jgi:site-specific recombinase XerD